MNTNSKTIGFETAENEPSKIWQMEGAFLPDCICQEGPPRRRRGRHLGEPSLFSLKIFSSIPPQNAQILVCCKIRIIDSVNFRNSTKSIRLRRKKTAKIAVAR